MFDKYVNPFALQIPPNSTEPLGVQVLKSRGIFPEAYWYWIGVGASIGYMLLFNFLLPLALHYLDRKYPFLYILCFSVCEIDVVL